VPDVGLVDTTAERQARGHRFDHDPERRILGEQPEAGAELLSIV